MATFTSNGTPITEPSPQYDIPIVSNNGVLKYGKPIMLDSTRYYAYLSVNLTDWSYSSDSYSISIPVTVGHKYKITVPATNPLNGAQNVIFRYAFTDSINTDWTSSTATGQTSIPAYDMVRTTPQDTPSVEVTATHPYLIIQMGASVFGYILTNNLITITEQSIYTDGTVETINVRGKNLFDSTPYKTGYYIDASGNEVEATQYQDEYLIHQARVQPSTQYTISLKGTVSGYTQRIHAYDAAGNWLSQVAVISTITPGVVSSASFTTPANCAYIRQGGRTQTEYQLEQGSTATIYEPYYNGGTATAEMLLKVGDYTDVQEVLAGDVTRKCGVLVLDGTENWQVNSSSNAPFRITISDMEYSSTIGLNNIFGVCSHFQAVANTASWVNYNNMVSVIENSRNVCFRYLSGISNVNTFKQFLADQYNAGKPVIVIYPLATPTTESVAGQTLQVQAGNNTLEITQASLSNLELEAKYSKSA